VIRPFRPSDLDGVVEVENASFPEGDRYSKSVFRYYYTVFPDLFFVAELCGRVVGYVIGEMRGSIGHVVSIAVHPSFRRRGIGWMLMDRVEGEMASRGAKLVYLEVAVDNTPAISMYTKRGYRVAGVVEKYYSSGADAYIMVKELERVSKTSS